MSYLPIQRKFPRVGVLFTCGHSADGKAYHLYHECCLGLVLKGYVVLALDPTGQGERAEYFDRETGKPLVPLCVSHHHYLARPSWLVGRTLAGYRTWDCSRALDYLVGRPEVDPQRIAVVGNSGGGIMALLITAFDERIKVCAAAHPGGSMEQTFLTGRRLPEADILSLIAPRPCLFVVGRDSGEEAGHRAKMDAMLPFYRGLGVATDRCQMALVDGVHNMKQPKREPCYGWLNRWFGCREEGTQEPELRPESVETLRCTKTGFTLRDLQSESGQTLNSKLARKLRPARPVPADRSSADRQLAEVRAALVRRLGARLGEKRPAPPVTSAGQCRGGGLSISKLLIQSEPNILLPALKIESGTANAQSPVILAVSETGKPTAMDQPTLALQLARAGYDVLAVDVRGTGETDPRVRPFLAPVTQYDPQQYRFDTCAVSAAQLNTTMLAMRAFDIVRTLDYLQSSGDWSGRKVVLLGEGLGGVWTLAAAALDPRPAAVVCVGMVPSYKLIVDAQYYAVRDYYWLAGALRDFDLPDLIALSVPRPITLINPLDAMLEPLAPQRSQEVCRWPAQVYRVANAAGELRLVHTAGTGTEETVQQVIACVKKALTP